VNQNCSRLTTEIIPQKNKMLTFEILKIIYGFLLGAALGSFILVVATRSHKEENWWSGRSKCDDCGKTLKWYELIPIFSFIFQRGRCKSCRAKLSILYPAVELFTGIITSYLIYRFNISFQFLLVLLIFISLINLFISDLLYMELSDLFMFTAIIFAMLYQFLYGAFSFTAILFGGLFFGVQYLLTQGKGLGEGDIILGLIMGLLLGWPLTIVSVMIAYISGSVISLLLIGLRKLNRKSMVPLGVFLIPSLMICFLFSSQIISFMESNFYVFSL
jgi:leader peptidase (prepilin peptidase)/N-methyltransferase